MTKPITISIAGTAGRKDDAFHLTSSLYKAAQEKTLELVEELGEKIHLVSGGAAYADHLAVRLFLEGKAEKLTLHLPCPFINGKYKDNGTFDWKKNPGGTANALHKKFQQKTGIDSFAEIAKAIRNTNCEVTVNDGFHARNDHMAKSDALIAITFGSKNKIKDGGTANTCKSYLYNIYMDKRENLSYHIDLSRLPLVAYKGIEVPSKEPKI